MGDRIAERRQWSFRNTGPVELLPLRAGDALGRAFALGVRLDRVFHDLNDFLL